MDKVITYLTGTRQTRLDFIAANYATDFTGCVDAYKELKLIDEITRDVKNL